MQDSPELAYAVARAFLDTWLALGPDVLGKCDQANVDALQEAVAAWEARILAEMLPANCLPI